MRRAIGYLPTIRCNMADKVDKKQTVELGNACPAKVNSSAKERGWAVVPHEPLSDIVGSTAIIEGHQLTMYVCVNCGSLYAAGSYTKGS